MAAGVRQQAHIRDLEVRVRAETGSLLDQEEAAAVDAAAARLSPSAREVTNWSKRALEAMGPSAEERPVPKFTLAAVSALGARLASGENEWFRVTFGSPLSVSS